MKAAIYQSYLDIDHLIAERTLAGSVLGGGTDRWDIKPRYRAADDAVNKRKSSATRARGEFERDIGELAVPAGLAFQPGRLLNGMADGFPVRGARSGGFQPHPERRRQPLHGGF